MIRGMDDDMAKKLGMIKADGSRMKYSDFNYLRVCSDLNPAEDIEYYNKLKDAFVNLGFS